MLHPDDDVLVAIRELPAGSELAEYGLVCGQDIPAGHKVARRDLAPGHQVRKYGQIIGAASQAIAAGDWVHTHNLAFGEFERDLAIGQETRPTVYVAEQERATFQGYLRPDGKAATRNYLGVLATVNCSASVCHFIASAASELLDDYPGVDGVVPLGHGFGCGGSTGSIGLGHLQRTMAGYARHPNFAGVLLVGLGCEGNQLDPAHGEHGSEPGQAPAGHEHPAGRGAPARPSSGPWRPSRRCCPRRTRPSARACRPACSRWAWSAAARTPTPA